MRPSSGRCRESATTLPRRGRSLACRIHYLIDQRLSRQPGRECERRGPFQCYTFQPSRRSCRTSRTCVKLTKRGRTSWRSLLIGWHGANYRVNVNAGVEAVPESSLCAHVARARMCPGRPHVGGAVGLHSSAPPKTIPVMAQVSKGVRRGRCKCQVSPRASISAAGARTRHRLLLIFGCQCWPVSPQTNPLQPVRDPRGFSRPIVLEGPLAHGLEDDFLRDGPVEPHTA
jgi:hypothetical protein